MVHFKVLLSNSLQVTEVNHENISISGSNRAPSECEVDASRLRYTARDSNEVSYSQGSAPGGNVSQIALPSSPSLSLSYAWPQRIGGGIGV
jgi:hypothetical protein